MVTELWFGWIRLDLEKLCRSDRKHFPRWKSTSCTFLWTREACHEAGVAVQAVPTVVGGGGGPGAQGGRGHGRGGHGRHCVHVLRAPRPAGLGAGRDFQAVTADRLVEVFPLGAGCRRRRSRLSRGAARWQAARPPRTRVQRSDVRRPPTVPAVPIHRIPENLIFWLLALIKKYDRWNFRTFLTRLK